MSESENNARILEDGTSIDHQGNRFTIKRKDGTEAQYTLAVNREGSENRETGTTISQVDKAGVKIVLDDSASPESIRLMEQDEGLVNAYFRTLPDDAKTLVENNTPTSHAEILAGLTPSSSFTEKVTSGREADKPAGHCP